MNRVSGGTLPCALMAFLLVIVGTSHSYEDSRDVTMSYQQFLNFRKRNSSLLESTCYHQFKGHNYQWKNQLYSAANILHKDRIIILTAGNWKYRDCTMNWMSWMHRHRLRSFITLVFDEDLLNYVGTWSSQGHGVFVPGCRTKMDYVMTKLHAIFLVLSHGFHVLWSDCDCVWLQPNIIDSWFKPYVKVFDLIGQKGQFPMQISREKGITLCTGFMFVACNNATAKLFRLVSEDTRLMHVASDQAILNFALMAEGSFDFIHKVEYKAFDKIKSLEIPSYHSYNNFSKSRNPLKLGFLPFPIFPRTRDQNEWALINAKYKPAIWHGHSNKTGKGKFSGLKEAGVFLLKNDWEKMPSISRVRLKVNNKTH
jgi:hypothetical protein